MKETISGADMQALWRSSGLSANNTAYLEQLYEDYLQDPSRVSPQWRDYFARLPRVDGVEHEVSHRQIREAFRRYAEHKGELSATPLDGLQQTKQVQVLQLINAYRFRGHLFADINPLKPARRAKPVLPWRDLSEADLDTVFHTGSLVGPETATLREIIDILEKTYCGSIGIEYMHIPVTGEKRWLQQRLETVRGEPGFGADDKQRLLRLLTAAEGLERYLHTRYLGQKRFSLEGAESLIPLLDTLIRDGAAHHAVEEIAIGMAHRGRLNVLVNIMGKQPAELFSEFEGRPQQNGEGTGDVKYHQGFSANLRVGERVIHLALAFNPSHLEIVGPVVEGSVRARQDRRQDKTGDKVIPVVIHGDAAFAGQGVVMETFNMSQSRGYSTKGTVHIVVNNQIGFTTSYQRDARSTFYCTDVAKMVNAPIFHVNGDDPEAVAFCARLALDYRMRFHKDVVIDLVCYRRHGHNEADEPWVTQPQMYSRIQKLPTTRQRYAERLVQQGVLASDGPKALVEEYRGKLEAGDSVVEGLLPKGEARYPYAQAWERFREKSCTVHVDTHVPVKLIQQLQERLAVLPEGFVLHGAVKRIMANRDKMARGELPVDWGFAETMAYATLVHEKFNVRLSGQDSGRGTFFHRHAVLHNQARAEAYVPLRNIEPEQGNFLVIDSLLSEEAVLAFEYGYASTDPNTLTIWEAQFGDFANGAQVVIDQFISAAEQKWDRLNGLVMFLPHGYEGQGPEHSSARLERYLQLCAQHNMQVCVPTTAAQIFHLLRRQMLLNCRKPLIVMTPKSLLRHKLAASPLEDLGTGEFRRVIGEIDELDETRVRRVVMCSGRVYYDLLERRRRDKRHDVAIIRMEQLYPFPSEEMAREFDRYPNATDFIWCQEEPKNQGSWFTSQHHVRAILGKRAYLEYAGRPFSAAPAVGYMDLHKKQQEALVSEALGEPA